MMADRKRMQGACTYCGKKYTRGGFTRHLQACSARAEAMAKAEKSRRRKQPLYHLQVQDAWGGDYWLHLELNGTASLEELDHYLRQIWLECCGHLSGFRIGDTFYTQIFDDGFGFGNEADMHVPTRRVLEPGMAVAYEYDFGSTTDLQIRVVGRRDGRPTTRHPIVLMARNEKPALACDLCGEPATMLCMECYYDETAWTFCDAHGGEHEHEEMLYPWVNSPRAGVCGYFGPAEPPYYGLR